MVHNKRARLIITLFVAVLLASGTYAAIIFAKGYRPSFNGQTPIQGTGLIAASSYPEQSSVFIDGKLTTTTNDTINIFPGKYFVRITKEGFIPWEKTLNVEKELVSTTNARLFPQVPSLTAATTSGAENPQTSPDGQRISYIVRNSQDSQNNGLYTIQTNGGTLGFDRRPTLIARLSDQYLNNSIQYVWSPDSKQILLITHENDKITNANLLDSDKQNTLTSLPDVTVRLPFIFSDWEKDLVKRETDLIKKLPAEIVKIASESAVNIYFSPDGEKMIYTATQNITLSQNIIPEVASINPTVQNRQLEKDSIYIYDTKEDTNYKVGVATTSATLNKKYIKKLLVSEKMDTTPSASAQETLTKILQEGLSPLETINAFKSQYSGTLTNNPIWYPTSRHIVEISNSKVSIKEYDNTNNSTIYAGPLTDSFIVPSPDGHRLYFITNLNQTNLPSNLYFLDLK